MADTMQAAPPKAPPLIAAMVIWLLRLKYGQGSVIHPLLFS
jgi:hypothetical protein